MSSNGGSTGAVSLTAAVQLTEIVGSDTTLHLAHEDIEFIALSQAFESFELDQQVVASFDPRQIHVFDAATGRVVLSAAEVR